MITPLRLFTYVLVTVLCLHRNSYCMELQSLGIEEAGQRLAPFDIKLVGYYADRQGVKSLLSKIKKIEKEESLELKQIFSIKKIEDSMVCAVFNEYNTREQATQNNNGFAEEKHITSLYKIKNGSDKLIAISILEKHHIPQLNTIFEQVKKIHNTRRQHAAHNVLTMPF